MSAALRTNPGDLEAAITRAEKLRDELNAQIAALRDQHTASPEDYCRVGNIAWDAQEKARELQGALDAFWFACNDLDDQRYESERLELQRQRSLREARV